jgi:putative transposase
VTAERVLHRASAYDSQVNFSRTFFVTSVAVRRQPVFRDNRTAVLLMETMLHYQALKKYLLHAFVIMPDHIHVLLTPAFELSLERAVQLIKGGFSYRLKSRFPVWQESFTSHRIRDVADFEQHVEYIHRNPVRAGLILEAAQYPYSSAKSRSGAKAPFAAAP